MSEWIQCSERLPERAGVYLVTILNREWNKDQIEDGAKPPRDEHWDMHANLYGQLSDGRWVMVGQRGYHDGVWTGYGETTLAWMPMPAPFTEKVQLSLFDGEEV